MALTRDFRETIWERVERDPVFREALLTEGIECVLAGEPDTGKVLLRTYVTRVTSGSLEFPRRRR